MADTPTAQSTSTQSNQGSNINPQAIALLQQLMSQQQNQPSMSLPNGGVGNTQGQQLGPYQKGVQKALQESGYNHASEAIQAGVSPDFISSHPLTTGQRQGQQSPQQILQGLTGGQQNQNQMPSVTSPQGPFTQPGFNPQTGNIQEGGFVNRALRGLAGGGILGALAGLAGPNATQQMAGLETAQKLKAGQPGEIALPQAQAGESTARGTEQLAEAQNQQATAANTNASTAYQNLKNAGREPLQQKDYLNAYASIAPKFYDALSAGVTSVSEVSKNASALFDTTANNTRTAFQKWTAKQSPESAKSLVSALGAQQAGIDAVHDYMKTLDKNNPSGIISSIKNKMSGSSEDNSEDNSGIKVGDKFNGEKVINVKRIK